VSILESAHVHRDGTIAPVEVHERITNWGGRRVRLAVVHDITERKKAEERLRESNARLEQVLQGTLGVIEQIVEASDPYTSGHQRRVAELAVAIGRQMGLPEESCISLIRTAAVIHDIGKTTVPSEILSKPGRLSPEEFGLIKTHSQVGYEIIKRANLPDPVAEVVLQHHERLDGSGYPQGLSGDDILPEAQILAVADVVEAMFSHRPYRPALGIDAALNELSAGSGTRYYPDVVAACTAVFREKGFTFAD
jgi:putative nucleotidyltransferase with HDIG domain